MPGRTAPEMTANRLAHILVDVGFCGLLAGVWWLDHSARADTVTRAGPELGFALSEVSRACGIDFVHQSTTLDPRLANVAPHVSAMGAAVSIADFDGDGWPDIYATSSRFGTPNALYKNLGDGRFEDCARAAHVADVNVEGEGVSMGSVWGDYDRDGHEDLFLYKWGYQQLLRNRGDGTFEDVSAASGVRRWMNSNAAVWLDYDRDGKLDLYIAGYFSEQHDMWHLKTTRIMQESFEFANNGGHNVLLHNTGGGRFEDVTAQTGTDSTRWTLAVASVDMNGDGWPDLYLANDYGPEELFLNVGGTRFEKQSGVGLEESSKSGMCVALGDFENDGRFGVYVTNISKERFLFQGNNLRINRLADPAVGQLLNVADMSNSSSRDVVDCGWAWGAQFGDLDNDGRLDLFVANGFVSASKTRDYWYGMSKVAGGASQVFVDATQWEPMGDASLSGYEQSRVLLGGARGRFRDVATAVGVTDLDDGRAVAFADLFNDGALDVVVANQKGPLLLYKNRVDRSRHWVEFQLRGANGNTSAIGAELTLHFGGVGQVQVEQVQAVQGGSGFCSQNDRRLHFGLGAAQAIDRAVIRWPSGKEQTLEHPAVDRLHVALEPAP